MLIITVLARLIRWMQTDDHSKFSTTLQQVKHRHPKRKLRQKYADILKAEIRQRLNEPVSSDPYVVMRDAQCGKVDNWHTYVKKERAIMRPRRR